MNELGFVTKTFKKALTLQISLQKNDNMWYIMFLRQLRHLPSSFFIFPSLTVGKWNCGKVGLRCFDTVREAQKRKPGKISPRGKLFSVTHLLSRRNVKLSIEVMLSYPDYSRAKMYYLYSFLRLSSHQQ